MSNKLSKFGEIARVRRVLKRESLSSVANAVGCSPSFMSAIEIGAKPPTVEMALKVASHFRMGVDETQDLVMAAIIDAESFKLPLGAEIEKKLSALMAIFMNTATKKQKQKTITYLNREIRQAA